MLQTEKEFDRHPECFGPRSRYRDWAENRRDPAIMNALIFWIATTALFMTIGVMFYISM